MKIKDLIIAINKLRINSEENLNPDSQQWLADYESIAHDEALDEVINLLKKELEVK